MEERAPKKEFLCAFTGKETKFSIFFIILIPPCDCFAEFELSLKSISAAFNANYMEPAFICVKIVITVGDSGSFRIPCLNLRIRILYKTPCHTAISIAAQVGINENISKEARAMFLMDK